MNSQAPLAARDPIQEARVRAYLMAGVQTELMWAMIGHNPDAQRIGMNLMAVLSDPVRWAKLADVIWGTV